jgi:hypothetical protein
VTIYYADASARVRHQVQKTGSERVQSPCTPGAGQLIAVAQIGLVEVAVVLGLKHRVLHTFRGCTEGE